MHDSFWGRGFVGYPGSIDLRNPAASNPTLLRPKVSTDKEQASSESRLFVDHKEDSVSTTNISEKNLN